MTLARWVRLANTVRHLRAGQIVFRVFYRVARRSLLRNACTIQLEAIQRDWKQAWDAPLVSARSYWDGTRFEFLGESGQVNDAVDWSSAVKSKLWLYNLHYLDDLNARDGETRRAEH